MSHGFLFSAFEQGDVVSVPPERLHDAFRAARLEIPPLSEGVNDLPDGLEDVGDVVIFVEGGKVVEAAINRPRYSDLFRQLCFQLVATAGLVMYADNGSSVFAANGEPADLPGELLGGAEEVNLSIRSPDDLP